jgi:tetratricopeptide (TPR) repeat protein
MNKKDHEGAVQHFEDYERTILELTPDADLTQKQVEFYNALATVYTKLYNGDREQLEYFKKAIAMYQKVMNLDKENYGANYNMATMWYNRGVYNIQQISPENDIPSIELIQKVSKEFFMQALPFMLKAHEQDPDRIETLMGLEGIYYSLQEEVKSDEYRAKIKELYGVE